MHYTAFFFLSIALALPFVLGAPGQYVKDKTELICSADTSDAAVLPFANNTDWTGAMTECLEHLSNWAWHGWECAPMDSQNFPLGPTFGFWKGETHYSSGDDAWNCYQLCSPCLQRGIDNNLAVTTSCQFKSYAWAGPVVMWTCNMGFDYGQPQQVNSSGQVASVA